MNKENEKLEDAIKRILSRFNEDGLRCDGLNDFRRDIETVTQAARRYAEVLPLLEELLKCREEYARARKNLSSENYAMIGIFQTIKEIAAIVARGD